MWSNPVARTAVLASFCAGIVGCVAYSLSKRASRDIDDGEDECTPQRKRLRPSKLDNEEKDTDDLATFFDGLKLGGRSSSTESSEAIDDAELETSEAPSLTQRFTNMWAPWGQQDASSWDDEEDAASVAGSVNVFAPLNTSAAPATQQRRRRNRRRYHRKPATLPATTETEHTPVVAVDGSVDGGKSSARKRKFYGDRHRRRGHNSRSSSNNSSISDAAAPANGKDVECVQERLPCPPRQERSVEFVTSA